MDRPIRLGCIYCDTQDFDGISEAILSHCEATAGDLSIRGTNKSPNHGVTKRRCHNNP